MPGGAFHAPASAIFSVAAMDILSGGEQRLRAADHWVPAAHLRPGPRINVQGQEPARLHGGCLQVTVTANRQPRGGPGLGDLYFGAAPIALGAEHRAQPRPG